MGRIGFAIARDGLIPPSIAKVHPRWGTPYRISAIMTVAVALLAGFLPLSALADLVSIGALCAFVLVSVAVPILRRKRPDLERPFRVPFSPVLPIVSALACFYLMLNLSVETWLRFLAWMLLGALIYFGYGHRRNRLAQHEPAVAPAPREPTADSDPTGWRKGPLATAGPFLHRLCAVAVKLLTVWCAGSPRGGCGVRHSSRTWPNGPACPSRPSPTSSTATCTCGRTPVPGSRRRSPNSTTGPTSPPVTSARAAPA